MKHAATQILELAAVAALLGFCHQWTVVSLELRQPTVPSRASVAAASVESSPKARESDPHLFIDLACADAGPISAPAR